MARHEPPSARRIHRAGNPVAGGGLGLGRAVLLKGIAEPVGCPLGFAWPWSRQLVPGVSVGNGYLSGLLARLMTRLLPVFGYSSGAVLALRAAAAGLAITRLVLYEPPFRPDDSYPPRRPIWPSR
jgi:hypothetical protein